MKYDYNEFIEQSPYLLEQFTNQIGQVVKIYEHPSLGDAAEVIAVIEGVAMDTAFFDTGDFYEGSEYNPTLDPDGKIDCYFQYQSLQKPD